MKHLPLIKLMTTFTALLILAGCTAQTQPSAIPTVGNTSLPAIPQPTQTRLPAETATPQITLVANYTPTPKLITPAPSEGTFFDQSVISPDGEWKALPAFETLSTGYRVSLTISNKDKSVIWSPVDYQGEGLGYSWPFPKGWSADSQYFYFLESTVSDGCGDFYPVEQKWQRIAVQSGKVEKIDLPVGRGHMFSPDESILAYVSADDPVTLVLLNVKDQTETRVPLPITPEEGQIPQAGGIKWSPDGDALILSASSGNICEGPRPSFFLLTTQISDLTLETLYHGDIFIRPLAWGANGKVHVMDWNSKSWWIDSTSGEITTAP